MLRENLRLKKKKHGTRHIFPNILKNFFLISCFIEGTFLIEQKLLDWLIYSDLFNHHFVPLFYVPPLPEPLPPKIGTGHRSEHLNPQWERCFPSYCCCLLSSAWQPCCQNAAAPAIATPVVLGQAGQCHAACTAVGYVKCLFKKQGPRTHSLAISAAALLATNKSVVV